SIWIVHKDPDSQPSGHPVLEKIFMLPLHVQAHSATTQSGVVTRIFLVPKIDVESEPLNVETQGRLHIADIEYWDHVFQLGRWHGLLKSPRYRSPEELPLMRTVFVMLIMGLLAGASCQRAPRACGGRPAPFGPPRRCQATAGPPSRQRQREARQPSRGFCAWLRAGIKPTVKRPSQWCIIVRSISHIDRRFPFQQQPDDIGVTAICGLVQSGFAVRPCINVHA